MLVTHPTLVKAVCLAVSSLLLVNFLYFSSVPYEQIITDTPVTSTTHNASFYIHPTHTIQSPQQSPSAYVDAPSIFNQLFSLPNPDRKSFQEWNARSLRDLHACIALNNCGPNQMKVALLADGWIHGAVVGDFRGGEGIWGISIHKNLHRLGYTTLFSGNTEEMLFQYRMMPDLVKVIIRSEAGQCHNDKNCVKGPDNPYGIPAWKLFDMSYWPDYRLNDRNHPMKGKWLLSAGPDYNFPDFDSSPIQYIGYSTEESCKEIPMIPLEERKNQVWMLMKQILYVYHHRFAWNRTYFPLVHDELGVDFVGGWVLDKDYLGWGKDIHEDVFDIEDHNRGVYNLGMQSTEDFYDQVRNSKIMIGMANPHWSPSPVEALCLGVPFLNPISDWDHEDPWNKSRWDTQHPTLKQYDRPYVYHVHAKNFTGFLEAIETAMKTPIDRFIPEHMTEKAVQGRLTKLMETDWRAKAEETLRQNMKKVEMGEEAYIFEL